MVIYIEDTDLNIFGHNDLASGLLEIAERIGANREQWSFFFSSKISRRKVYSWRG
jgi:hypothetical protein